MKKKRDNGDLVDLDILFHIILIYCMTRKEAFATYILVVVFNPIKLERRTRNAILQDTWQQVWDANEFRFIKGFGPFI
jgi:hypothetical protein